MTRSGPWLWCYVLVRVACTCVCEREKVCACVRVFAYRCWTETSRSCFKIYMRLFSLLLGVPQYLGPFSQKQSWPLLC